MKKGQAGSPIVHANFHILPHLPESDSYKREPVIGLDGSQQTRIVKFLKKIFQKENSHYKAITVIPEPDNPNLIYKLSCQKLRYRSSLLDQTLILNSMDNYFGIEQKPRHVKTKSSKKKVLRLNMMMNATSSKYEDEDTPLGMLKF